MAEKTLILKVDLSCELCRKKMQKIFSKYQDKWNIKKITWDDKNDKITLVGPFDPEKLKKKLCCKACKTIKEYIIPEPPKPAPPKPEPPKPEPPKPEPPKPEPPKPEPPKPEPPKPEPPKPEPPKPEPPKPAPPPAYPPTLWVTGQICTCGTCHEEPRPCSCGTCHEEPRPRPCSCGTCHEERRPRPCSCGTCHEERRPCSCGCSNWYYGSYGYPPAPMYGRPVCQFFCDEDPSSTCSIL